MTTGARATFSVAWAATALAVRRSLANRGDLFFAGGFYLLVTAMLSSVWRVAARFNGDDIAGYSAVALTWYIATTEAVVVSLPQRMIDDIGTDIGSGAVATEMLRPASVLSVRVATQLGVALPKLALCAGVGFAYASIAGGLPISALALVLAAPALVLAITLNVIVQHAFAAASFWVRDAKAMWFLYSKLVFVAGGMLLPIQVLPDAVQTVAFFAPFSSMAYVPGRLASGHVEPGLLGLQLVWIAIGAVVAFAVFRAGERRVVEVGA